MIVKKMFRIIIIEIVIFLKTFMFISLKNIKLPLNNRKIINELMITL